LHKVINLLRSSSISNHYDNVIKESLNAGVGVIMRKVLNIDIKDFTPLDTKLQITEQQEPDFLVKIETEQGESSIIHLEFQSTNDDDVEYRMLNHFVSIHETYDLPIHQVLIYTGQEKLTMSNQLEFDTLSYSFELIDMRNMPPASFLESEYLRSLSLRFFASATKVKNLF